MNILILEDEQHAARRLRQLLAEVAPGAKVIAVFERVQQTLAWFAGQSRTGAPQADLILSDIQLADGLSLDVFKQVNSKIPVIFTTAYDAYTLTAFKLNSIDYLLKPIDREELKAALEKFDSLYTQHNGMNHVLSLFQSIAAGKGNYKTRFMVRQGDRLTAIPVEELGYIRADDKVVFLHTKTGQKYIIDDALDDLEKVLDPGVFFRINRTYIAPLASIDKIHNHFNGRLKITLTNSDDAEIFVSRARVAAFKKWLDR